MIEYKIKLSHMLATLVEAARKDSEIAKIADIVNTAIGLGRGRTVGLFLEETTRYSIHKNLRGIVSLTYRAQGGEDITGQVEIDLKNWMVKNPIGDLQFVEDHHSRYSVGYDIIKANGEKIHPDIDFAVPRGIFPSLDDAIIQLYS